MHVNKQGPNPNQPLATEVLKTWSQLWYHIKSQKAGQGQGPCLLPLSLIEANTLLLAAARSPAFPGWTLPSGPFFQPLL